MRQLSCMSTDVYCHKSNNHFYTQTERRGKGLAAGETERERVCERQRMKMELASVVKMAVGRRINYFEFSREPNIRITFS
jgi:hypothetical protein